MSPARPGGDEFSAAIESWWRQFSELLESRDFAAAARVATLTAEAYEGVDQPQLAVEALSLASTAYCFARDHEAAKGCLERAFRLAPADPATALALAKLILDSELERALELVGKAIQLSSRNPSQLEILREALEIEGVIFLRLGKIDDAVERFAACVERAAAGPSMPSLETRLALELAEHGVGLELCEHFANEAREWAASVDDEDLSSRVERLQGVLDTSRTDN